MKRYKVKYEGFRIVEAESAEDAELREEDYIYGERIITDVEEIENDDMLMDI